MHKALIIAAGLALTSVPALAHDMGMGSDGDRPSYNPDQYGGDEGNRPDWWGQHSRDRQGEWRYGGRNWRWSDEDQDRRADNEDQGAEERHGGGAAFRLDDNGVKLSVRCGRQETLRDCMAAAASLLRQMRAQSGQAPPSASPSTSAPSTPSQGPQPAEPTPKQP
jgi:hypothetical protein